MADSDKNHMWLPDSVIEDNNTGWVESAHCMPDDWDAKALPSWGTVSHGVSSLPSQITTATSARGFNLSHEHDTPAPCFIAKLDKVTSLLKDATTKVSSYAPGAAAATAGALTDSRTGLLASGLDSDTKDLKWATPTPGKVTSLIDATTKGLSHAPVTAATKASALADTRAGLSASARDPGIEDTKWAIDNNVHTQSWFDFTSLAVYASEKAKVFKAAFFANLPGLHSEEATTGPELGVPLDTMLNTMRAHRVTSPPSSPPCSPPSRRHKDDRTFTRGAERAENHPNRQQWRPSARLAKTRRGRGGYGGHGVHVPSSSRAPERGAEANAERGRQGRGGYGGHAPSSCASEGGAKVNSRRGRGGYGAYLPPPGSGAHLETQYGRGGYGGFQQRQARLHSPEELALEEARRRVIYQEAEQKRLAKEELNRQKVISRQRYDNHNHRLANYRRRNEETSRRNAERHRDADLLPRATSMPPVPQPPRSVIQAAIGGLVWAESTHDLEDLLRVLSRHFSGGQHHHYLPATPDEVKCSNFLEKQYRARVPGDPRAQKATRVYQFVGVQECIRELVSALGIEIIQCDRRRVVPGVKHNPPGRLVEWLQELIQTIAGEPVPSDGDSDSPDDDAGPGNRGPPNNPDPKRHNRRVDFGDSTNPDELDEPDDDWPGDAPGPSDANCGRQNRRGHFGGPSIGPSGSCRSSGQNSSESSGSPDVYAETRLSLICNEAPAHACSNADCDNIRWFDTRDDSWSRYCSNKCRIDAAAPTCSIANCPYACWLDEDGSWSQWCGNKCRRAAQEALYELKDITFNEQLGATSSYAMDAENSGDGRMWLFQRPGHQVL